MRSARLGHERAHGPSDMPWRAGVRADPVARGNGAVQGERRLGPASLEVLRLLEMCRCAPVDVLTSLLGSGRVSTYQLLGRLRRAGLAEVRRVDLGYLVGERPLGLWSLTTAGREAVARLGAVVTGGWPARPGQLTDDLPRRPRLGPRSRELPLVVAAYRLLAATCCG